MRKNTVCIANRQFAERPLVDKHDQLPSFLYVLHFHLSGIIIHIPE